MPALRITAGRPFAEALAAVVLLGGTGLAGVRAARAYDTYVRPAARSVPTVTPTPFVDPAVARENARRQRLASDHVGAGIAMRQVNPRAAIDDFMRALAIDPGNAEARQNLIEMGITPPAGPVPTPTSPPPAVILTVTPRVTR
jgi:hypothetical protein